MINLSAIEIEDLIKKRKQQLKDDYYVKKLYEQKILALKNPRLSYFFAKEISCADIMAHRQGCYRK